jgi:uncharacterized membrane protein
MVASDKATNLVQGRLFNAVPAWWHFSEMKDIKNRLPAGNVAGIHSTGGKCIKTMVAFLTLATVALVTVSFQETARSKGIVGCDREGSVP